MRHHLKQRARRSGIATLWVAITILMLVLFAGMAIDTMYAVLTAQQLQAGADAAALAGAARIRDGDEDARLAAIAVALDNTAAGADLQLADNPANDPTGDIVLGTFDRSDGTFTPTLDGPNAVRVVARKTDTSLNGPLGLLFGPAFGIDNWNVSRPAIAMVGGGTGAGLIALNYSEPCTLLVEGTPLTLTVNNIDPETGEVIEPGAIQVNSNHRDAFCHSGRPTINAGEINIKGDSTETGTEAGTDRNLEDRVHYDGELDVHQPIIPDPLLWLGDFLPPWDPADDLGTVQVTGSAADTVNLVPGYYSGGISMDNNLGTLNLAPGVYVVDGHGLNITGGNLYAHNVMFYVIDTTPDNQFQSNVDLVGNGILEITPPDSGIYEGISIFQDYDNHNDSRILGTNSLDLEGTLYFPENHLQVGGEGAGFGNQLIADTIEVHGTGEILINYDGRNPSPGGKVFLVK